MSGTGSLGGVVVLSVVLGVILFVLLSVSTGGSMSVVWGLKSHGVEYPESLPDGYEVIEVYSGREAVEMVKGLHWNPAAVNVSDALVVIYSDGVRVWVSVTPQADELLDRMMSKIMEYQGRVPFVPAHDVEVGGVRVYLMYDASSPGKVHTLWARGDLLVWVEVPGEVGIPPLS